MFDEFTSGNESSDSSETMTEMEMLQAGAILASAGHAMADYVLNNFESFASFVFTGTGAENRIEVSEDGVTAADRLRVNVDMAHDMFAALAASAAQKIFMVRLTDMLSSSNGII